MRLIERVMWVTLSNKTWSKGESLNLASRNWIHRHPAHGSRQSLVSIGAARAAAAERGHPTRGGTIRHVNRIAHFAALALLTYGGTGEAWNENIVWGYERNPRIWKRISNRHRWQITTAQLVQETISFGQYVTTNNQIRCSYDAGSEPLVPLKNEHAFTYLPSLWYSNK